MKRQVFGKAAVVHHHPQMLLGFAVHCGAAQQARASLVGMHQTQHQLERGGFARAVFPDEAHDAAFGQRKGKVVQRKAGVALGQPRDLQGIVHRSSSL